MYFYILSITLVIVSNVFYQYIPKSTPGHVNPILSLIITYLTAIVASLMLLPFFPAKEGIMAGIKNLNWTSYALGITVVGLEAGFLLAYRAGWNISTVAVTANIIVALILIPAGIVLYKETLSLINSIGIVLSVLGLFLISYK